MRTLVVVENPKRWPFDLEEVEVVPARVYLVERRFAEMRRAAVYNMCRRLGYQSVGYYVSLLAAARGHRPLPSVETVQALTQSSVVRIASEELDAEIQRAFGRLHGSDFRLSIYFGRNVAKRYDRLSRALFDQFPAPFLLARFARSEGGWRMISMRPGATSEIPEIHRDFVLERAREYFRGRGARSSKTKRYRYDLAVLWSPDDPTAPSDERAIRRFIRAAAREDINAEIVGASDYGRLAEFDALFLRETTRVNHHTYRFATRAVAEGLVVIDRPESIVRAANKVYQAELFGRHGIPCPRTMVVHDTNVGDIVGRVGLPCVLKKPDGAFSVGVVKVNTEEEAKERLASLLAESELIVAQEFVPSAFDWRVGVLDGRLLYVCRYHMAKGHWQIVRRGAAGPRYGRVEAARPDEAPQAVLAVGVRAASLFGDGLYGVDVKQVDGRILVMEVNDNPNLDAGYEDGVLKDALYDEIARWFRVRLDGRGTKSFAG